jgi:multidrug resistance efflux pump
MNHETRPAAALDSTPPPRPLSLSERVQSLRLPERQLAEPTGRSSRLAWALCVVLALVTAYLAVGRLREESADVGESKAVSADSFKATPDRPPGEGELVLESKGWILATRTYKVGPNQVGGKVIWLNKKGGKEFLEGRNFMEGELLAKLEDTEYQAKYVQAKKDWQQAKFEVEAAERRKLVATYNRKEEVKQAEAELAEARSTLEKLRLDLERNDKLRTGGAIAKHDYEEAKFTYEAQRHHVKMLSLKYEIMAKGPRWEIREESEANLKKAERNLERAQAAMKEAEWRLDNCKIYAPISGKSFTRFTMLKKYVEIGDPLDARAFNLASILCDMADLTDLEVELNVPERDIARVQVGQPCRIVPEAHLDKVFKGTVSRMMPTADRAKGAIPVRVKVNPGEIKPEEAGKYLSPDGAATVTIFGKKQTGAGKLKG